MPKARLIHNTKAGSGALNKEQLTGLVERAGYTLSYFDARKDGWDRWDEDDDLIIVAGGDGTVRKVVDALLQRKLIDKRFPLAVLPLGTANNIAGTLYQQLEPESVIRQWSLQQTRAMDIARLRGIKQEHFFMEGLGVGVFPQLMKEMKKEKKRKEQHPKQELHSAQQLFCEIVSRYKARYCQLFIDGQDYSGKYLLIEIMNMQAVGPNLNLAPAADPADGWLEVVLVPASAQKELLNYARIKAGGREASYAFQAVRGRNISLRWSGSQMHVDDSLIRSEKNSLMHIELETGLLKFYTAAPSV